MHNILMKRPSRNNLYVILEVNLLINWLIALKKLAHVANSFYLTT